MLLLRSQKYTFCKLDLLQLFADAQANMKQLLMHAFGQSTRFSKLGWLRTKNYLWRVQSIVVHSWSCVPLGVCHATNPNIFLVYRHLQWQPSTMKHIAAVLLSML